MEMNWRYGEKIDVQMDVRRTRRGVEMVIRFLFFGETIEVGENAMI